METPDITVVVCTYNRAGALHDALHALTSQHVEGDEFTFEVLVVNDGSTDSTSDVVEATANASSVPVRSVWGDGTTLGATRNRGIEEARGRWIAFFDDDQRASAHWLKGLWLARETANAEYVGGPIVLELPSGTEGVGPACRAILGEYPPARRRRHEKPLPPGGNRMIDRTLLDRIGWHDESIVTGGEDYDLLVRAINHGARFGWAPSAVVYHVIPAERLSVDAMRSYCRLSGVSRARSDARYLDKVRLVGESLRRIGVGWIANTVVLAWAVITRSPALIADCRARYWLTSGYVQQALRDWTGVSVDSGSFREIQR